MAARQPGDGARVGHVDPPLQQFKTRPTSRVERGNFPIDDRLPRMYLVREDRKLRILFVHYISVARKHAQLAGFDKANGTDAVPFNFVDPVATCGWLAFAEFSQHWSCLL